jgi:hypothetical protein
LTEIVQRVLLAAIVGLVSACSSQPPTPPSAVPPVQTPSPAPAPTAPTFVGETHSATDGCCGLEFNNTTLTLNVTGTDRLLTVAWHSEWDGGPAPAPTPPNPNAWSVTNNGVPNTVLVDTNGYTGGDGNRRFRIYYWLNPPVGTNTIKVSNPNTGPNELSAVALLFNGVNQAHPLGDVVLRRFDHGSDGGTRDRQLCH